MSIYKRATQRTVVRDLTIGLVLTITVVIVAVSLSNYFRALRQAEEVLVEQARRSADNIAQVLAQPLWSFDTAAIEQIAFASQELDDLDSFYIFDKDGEILFNYLSEDMSANADLIHESRLIVFQGSRVGSVEIQFSKREIIEQQQKTLSNLGTTLVFVILALVVANQLLLQRLLSRPLNKLLQGLDIFARGDYNYKLPQIAQGDIDIIAQRANEMAEQIADRDNQLLELVQNLEQRVDERTQELQGRADQLDVLAKVASSVASLQDVEELLPDITKTISESFDFYHTGIFLLSDDKEFAVLRAANSKGGQAMVARKHQLRIGGEGIVGFAAEQRIARIALDVGDDATYFDNPDMPDTRSEMALPLIFGDELIGVLDVQSREPNAFSNEDIDVLSTLANQVAVAIQNARLLKKSQDQLKVLDASFRRYISNEWQQYAKQTNVIGYRASDSGLEPITVDQKEAVSKNGNHSIQKTPIILRGATLGSLNIDMGEGSEEHTAEEKNLIQTVADRLALALESARLLESSQKAAAKEQTIGEITGKISASINLRNVLQTAVEELGRSIPGSEVVIKLEPDKE